MEKLQYRHSLAQNNKEVHTKNIFFYSYLQRERSSKTIFTVIEAIMLKNIDATPNR